MSSAKLKLRADVLKILEPYRNINAIDDKIAKKVFNEIKKVDSVDLEFISRLLIKEANPKQPKAATLFIYIAQNLVNEKFVDYIIDDLESKRVSDEKKFFLINLLSGLGINFSSDEIEHYLSNPDKTINSETIKFLDNATVSPEIQIDFLDFYYSSEDFEKREILNTAFSDFEKDKILNIIIGVMLSDEYLDNILSCLEYVKKIKSPLLKRPLEYLKESKNEAVSKKADKIYRKMLLQNVFNKEATNEFYKELFFDFQPPEICISYPDGNSNFSVVISRKHSKECFELIFIAVNLSLGPFACFGFSNLTKEDKNTIFNRFFNNNTKIVIENSSIKKILFELTKKRFSIGKSTPYEYFCWERIIEDIEMSDLAFSEILHIGLNKIKLDETDKKILLKTSYVKDWYYKNSKHNPQYSSFIEKIENIDEDKIFNIENYLLEYSKNEILLSTLKQRVEFLAFCLKANNENKLADMYYSSIFDNDFLIRLASNLLKRSIYEHYMNIKYLKKTNKKNVKNKQNEDLFILYAKKNWTV